ncbi:MAG: hypothetical protein EAZ55_01690 [Cytophagales bacterium]|nr:MAG: hypothetical protein EAZ55_01690 [Cytophagales bacterium]
MKKRDWVLLLFLAIIIISYWLNPTTFFEKLNWQVKKDSISSKNDTILVQHIRLPSHYQREAVAVGSLAYRIYQTKIIRNNSEQVKYYAKGFKQTLPILISSLKTQNKPPNLDAMMLYQKKILAIGDVLLSKDTLIIGWIADRIFIPKERKYLYLFAINQTNEWYIQKSPQNHTPWMSTSDLTQYYKPFWVVESK